MMTRDGAAPASSPSILPEGDPLGALYAGAPEDYVELVSALIDYEREHDAAELHAFDVAMARARLVRNILDFYEPLIRASVHDGLEDGWLSAARGGAILAWLASERYVAERTVGALYVAHSRWQVRRLFDRFDDVQVQAALLAFDDFERIAARGCAEVGK